MEPLRILLVEDSENDAMLLLHEVRRGGYEPLHKRVDKPEDMLTALESQEWDVVISDHRMPHFSAPAAMELLEKSGLDLPFIIVSGTMGEDLAVEALKSGANDYIVKGNFSRLVPAIKRSIQEAKVRQEHRLAEAALQENEEKFRTLFQNANDVIFVYRLEEDDVPGHFVEVNDLASAKLGYTREEYVNLTPAVLQVDGNDFPRGCSTFESVLRAKSGQVIPFEVSSHVFNLNGERVVLAICRDITERKKSEDALKTSLDKLKRTMEGIVMLTAKTVEMRDPYTAGHQRSVAKLAQSIAEKLGLDEDETTGIRFACEIHDLGKIYVPAEILSKPGRLNSLERDMIKTHPQMGYEILKMIDFPWPIAAIVAQHHERIDGSGYPGGIKGNDISMGAKILGVADVVEAIASHRPYRPALGMEAALKEIFRNRGVLYEPDVVDACLEICKDENFNLEAADMSLSLVDDRDV